MYGLQTTQDITCTPQDTDPSHDAAFCAGYNTGHWIGTHPILLLAAGGGLVYILMSRKKGR